MADEITTLLNSYHSNTLWEMAHAAGLEVTDQWGKKLRKAEVIRKMRTEFFTRQRVLASLERLNQRERAVLNRLLLRGGTVPTKSLRREALRAGLVTVTDESNPRDYYYPGIPYAEGYAGDPARLHSTKFADVIARLTYHGLVFSRGTPLTSGSTPYKLQFHPGTMLYVPEVVRRYLPEPEPIPVEVSDWQPEQVQPADPALLLRDLYLYWDFVRRNDVPLLRNGLVGKRSLRAINSVLLAPDPLLEDAGREDEMERLYLLRLLLEKLGLLHRQKGRLCLADEDVAQVPPFWDWRLPKQLEACLEAWSKLDAIGKRDKGTLQYGPRYSHARQVVMDALRTLPATAWFDLEDLLERVQDRDTDFLFANRSQVENYRSSWYYSHSDTYYYGSTKELLKKFEQFERDLIESCATGFLHQLGLADLGYVRGRWQAFRLTPLGKVLLDGDGAQVLAESAQEETGRLVVQPSFQLLAIGPVSLGWLARLDLFAERERADRGAFEYRLSRDSVYQGQQLGLDVSGIVRFLQETSGVELPQNVRRSVEEWGAHYERIVFRTGVSLLQAADADLLTELTDDPLVDRYLARPLSPEVALLQKGGAKPLIAVLVERGLFPAVSGAEPEAADDSVIVQEDGVIRPIHAVPSLHLHGRLFRLAEEMPDGTWRLTDRSVRRAGGSKNKVLRLLEELSKLHRGTLSPDLIEQIKAWGGYYGNAAMETLTLVEFRSQDTLDELRKHSDLQALLTPFPAGNRALAAVPAGKLAEVKEILARFGIRLREGL